MFIILFLGVSKIQIQRSQSATLMIASALYSVLHATVMFNTVMLLIDHACNCCAYQGCHHYNLAADQSYILMLHIKQTACCCACWCISFNAAFVSLLIWVFWSLCWPKLFAEGAELVCW